MWRVYNRRMKPFTDNRIIKDIFTEEDYEAIYKVVDNLDMDSTKLVESMGQRAYLTSLGEPIREKLEKRVQELYGEDWILKAYQFARYTKKWGYETKLYPHLDDAFEDHKITLDVQLKSTIAWPIVVEGQEFTLNDNEGVFFSGTDQVHWRKKMDLSEDDVVDMIFCHCSNPTHPDSLISDEWRKQRAETEKYWIDVLNISSEDVKLGE